MFPSLLGDGREGQAWAAFRGHGLSCFRGAPGGTDEALSADTEVVERPAKEETVIENATPDYAAGLVSTQVGSQPQPHVATVLPPPDP